jgi:hypothetical protein
VNVKRVWTTWTQLADRAAELALAPSSNEVDRLLLVALAQRLRAAGLAATPHLPIDGAALGLALGAFPHIRRLREHLLEWFRGLSWLPGTWTREARYETWVDLSVCAHLPLKLAKSDVEGKDRWITWWAEVYAPAKEEEIVAMVQGTFTEARKMGRAEGRTEGEAAGRTEGEAAANARAVLTVLRVRGIVVSDADRERILGEKDPVCLERWHERAVLAASVAEVIAEPSRAA